MRKGGAGSHNRQLRQIPAIGRSDPLPISGPGPSPRGSCRRVRLRDRQRRATYRESRRRGRPRSPPAFGSARTPRGAGCCLRRPGRSPPLEPRHCPTGSRPLRPGPALAGSPALAAPPGSARPLQRRCGVAAARGSCENMPCGDRQGRNSEMGTDGIAIPPATRPGDR